MDSAIFSTAYLPSVSYFRELLRYPVTVIENDEHYTRQTARNRCFIYGPNGIQRLSIPVIHPGTGGRNIRDIRIDHSLPWTAIHWRSLEAAYNKSPYFLHYRDELEKIYRQKIPLLLDLNTELLHCCLKLMKADRDIRFSDTFSPRQGARCLDLRENSPGRESLSPMTLPRYPQVFEPAHGFIPGLSIADLLFNRGTDSYGYLKQL
jgi:hypothetical protein